MDGDVSKSELLQQIKLILDEIGFKKQMKVIRWLGYVLAKICQKVCTGIYVNQLGIDKVVNITLSPEKILKFLILGQNNDGKLSRDLRT